MIAAVMLAAVLAASPSVAAPREFPGMTMSGPTGLITVPTGQVLRANWYAFGLHRGAVKAAVGVLDFTEFGVALPDLYDDPNRHVWLNGTRAFLKVGGDHLPHRWWVPGIAGGAENSILRLTREAGISTREGRKSVNQESLYVAGTWYWNIFSWPVEATVGAGSGRFLRRAFGGGSVIPMTIFGSTLKFTGEYAGNGANVGARFALSRYLRLDFAMLLNAIRDRDRQGRMTITIDRGTMGASQADKINWGAFKSKPKEAPKR